LHLWRWCDFLGALHQAESLSVFAMFEQLRNVIDVLMVALDLLLRHLCLRALWRDGAGSVRRRALRF
jgi:hypothetical protein